jgi:hypothetical protein
LKPPPTSHSKDRRSYFRIHDDVVMTFRALPAEELPATLRAIEQTLSDNCTVSATFAGISQRMVFLKKQIRRESAAVAAYLDILEDKLDLLARALLLRDMGVDEEDTHQVNLSAGGIEFHTSEPIAEGSLLEMKFVVFPSRHSILTCGRAIRCEPDCTEQAKSYKVAVEFTFIQDTDRQLIVKHVLGKQSSQLRQQRISRGPRRETGPNPKKER